MATSSREHVFAAMRNLRESGAFSDLKLTCGDATYAVHKNIVCERATFFKTALSFGGQETETGTIDLPDDERETIDLVLQYIYEGEYEPISANDIPMRILVATNPERDQYSRNYTYEFPHTCRPNEIYSGHSPICPHHECGTGDCYGCTSFTCEDCTVIQYTVASPQILVHSKMYEIADRYGVIGLKDLAKEKFKRSCVQLWDEPTFGVAAHHAFSTTPDTDEGLRQIVSETISSHMSLITKPEIKVLLNEYNGLALGILEEKSRQLGWLDE